MLRGCAMTKRRKLLLAGAAVATAVVVLSLPAVRWPLVGWWRGEPFYDSRPASYWSAAVAPLSSHYKLVGPAPGIECYAPDCLFPAVRRRLGRVVPTRLLAEGDVPLGQGHPAAVPVLRALLCEPDEQSQAYAAWALARVGPAAADAVPELRELAGRKPRDFVAATAQGALRYIEAAPQAP
jgi:hypothetical protein